MRRATVVTIGVLLASLPAVAQAKGGIEFDTYPDTAAVGKDIGFTVIAMKDPTRPMQSLTPVVGRRALVTFRSESGRVLRIRTGPTDSGGMAHGRVAFPDKGPWTSELRVADVKVLDDMSQPIHVGIGLTQTTPSTKAPPAGSPGSDPAPAADAANASGAADASSARGYAPASASGSPTSRGSAPASASGSPSSRGSAPASASDSDSGPWIWIFSIAAIGSAAVLFAMRRRRRWGAA